MLQTQSFKNPGHSLICVKACQQALYAGSKEGVPCIPQASPVEAM